jgi:protein tyrosine/serine phosphatase
MFANMLLYLLLGKLKDFAIVVITNLAKTDLSSEEKRKAAFDEIKKQAKSAGRDLKDSVINLVIELCVQIVLKKN